MNRIYCEVNKRSGNKYAGLRFPSLTLGRRATVTVLCDRADRPFVDANLAELTAIVGDICGFHVPVELAIKDDPPTAIAVRGAVVRFADGFSYVASVAHSVTVELGERPCVRMTMHNAMYELAENDFIPQLKEFLSDNFVKDIAVEVERVDYDRSVGRQSARSEYELSDVSPVIGNLMAKKARSVSTITANEYGVTVCGVLAMPTSFVSKGGRRYERFVLYDGDMSVQCRLSADAGGIAGRDMAGKTVVVSGNAEYDGMRDEGSLYVRELSLCNAEGIGQVAERPEPDDYYVVRPQPYEEYVQSTVFDGDLSTPASLSGSFVVFDFETTGLSLLRDTPTELGAVKIRDGRLVESFSTLIDPRRPIPEEVVKKTGITDEMVKGKPLFEDILPDFYKFCYGAAVVCHNIAFDFPILLKGGNKTGWAFGKKRTFDTMGLAPAALSGISKLSLDKILEELGLVNDNAHRALSDAIATAKAFIELNRRLSRR